MTVSEGILNRLKELGYTYLVEWFDVKSVPDTMKDGSVFVEVVNVGETQTSFKLTSLNIYKIQPTSKTLRFNLVNLRKTFKSVDAYADRMAYIIKQCIILDKVSYPSVGIIESAGGDVLQDARVYLFQFLVKVTSV
jgi:hypothetical protein